MIMYVFNLYRFVMFNYYNSMCLKTYKDTDNVYFVT